MLVKSLYRPGNYYRFEYDDSLADFPPAARILFEIFVDDRFSWEFFSDWFEEAAPHRLFQVLVEISPANNYHSEGLFARAGLLNWSAEQVAQSGMYTGVTDYQSFLDVAEAMTVEEVMLMIDTLGKDETFDLLIKSCYYS